MSSNFFEAAKNFKQPEKKRYFLEYDKDGTCTNITLAEPTGSFMEIDLETTLRIQSTLAMYFVKDGQISKKERKTIASIKYPQWREKENGYICQDDNMFWPTHSVISGGKGFVYEQD